MRYKPWGEVRYSWTNDTLNANPAYALTKYTFTGQYSHMDDPSTPASEGFGLMHYGARMYDPALGRFTSADTIVPGGVQGYDRYAYVNNSPVNYVDPSGHEPKYGCYQSSGNTCLNSNGTELKEGNGKGKEPKQKEDGDDELIFACGFDAGVNCDNTAGYDGLPLTPYYQLGTPSIYGVDGYGRDKLAMAIAIYNLIKSNPGKYTLVGHSAGATALIIAVSLLQRDGLDSQIKNLVLLDPAMDTGYKIDEYGNIDIANSINPAGDPNGIPLFLGDSTVFPDGPDYIDGSIRFPTTVDHLQLANNPDIFNLIVSDPRWSR
ncbi:MAG: RHS repeat-associated core domain-containing protein [Chloroflexi bacterium]|nr:RHS repeat-associated core domain-containing protein [Chloroflexota bacterium]